MKTEGELKQVQINVMDAAASLKDKVQNLIDRLKNAASNVVENTKWTEFSVEMES